MQALAHAGKNHSDRAVLVLRDVWASISERLRRRGNGGPRLAILERVAVAPKQTVALLEVEGEKLLVGTSQEGAPRFFRLHGVRQGTGTEHCDAIPLEGTIA